MDDIVEWARSGRIRIPTFQRGLRWTRRDVLQLFDSIQNGYPIGSLLLWERDAPAETVTLGPIIVEAAADRAFYVVDGQQRITALTAALTNVAAGDARFQVGYDLSTETFVGQSPYPPETYVPAHVLFDLQALLQWFRDRPDIADGFEDATMVTKTLRELRVPAYVVDQEDERVLQSIFDRMNNAGKKLSRDEVFAALHRPAGRSGEVTLRAVAESVESRTGFGLLDDSTAMQAILVRRGADVMREIRNEFEADARGRDAFAAREPEAEAFRLGTEAVVLAVEFLQQVAAVPHLAMLPYQYVLVALTRFFAHHPEPSTPHVRLLRRFFWRAVVHGPTLGRGTTTGVGRMLNRGVVPDDEVASVSALVAAVAGRPEYPGVNPFRTNSAASKALLCAMWAHGPRSIRTGQVLEVEDLRRQLGESQTAVDAVASLDPRARERSKDAGNRLLLLPEDNTGQETSTSVAKVDEAVLESHLLEAADVEFLQGSSVPEVIARRNDRLDALQGAFLDRMCEWEQEDTPDLAALAADDITDAAS